MMSARVRALAVSGVVCGAAGLAQAAEVGPDITVLYIGEGPFSQYEKFGPVNDIVAFAFATTSCNRGDVVAQWFTTGLSANRHPVIAQQAYRYDNGVMEQIGLAWLKHGFCAVNEPGCGTCQPTECDTLGIGCADTYWAMLNANGLAPRAPINAASGNFPFPVTQTPTGNSIIRGRLQVSTADLYEGPTYLFEGQYVAWDDANAGNKMNNASYRIVDIDPTTYVVSNIDGHTTVEAQTAMDAWKTLDPEVMLERVDVEGDGRIEVACRVFDNGDGTWRYEYAVRNFNSHQCVGSVSIPASSGVTVSSIGFHDVDHHSGEVWDTTDWPGVRGGEDVSWATTPFGTNPNANAIRWATTYNFRFVADQPPVVAEATLGLFRNGATVTAPVMVPGVTPVGCPGDVTGDNTVDFDDLDELLAQWGMSGGSADVYPFPAGDGAVDFNDLNEVLELWGTGCE